MEQFFIGVLVGFVLGIVGSFFLSNEKKYDENDQKIKKK